MSSLVRVGLFNKGSVLCAPPEGMALPRGGKCVVEMEHGLEVGTCLGAVAGGDGESERPARVVRLAVQADVERQAENARSAEEALGVFAGMMAGQGTPVKPLMAHYSLGRERLLIVFGAPEHVDCRRIVGKLQWDLKTRVEVRHVGVRDEAAVAGGIGPCGRVLCCASWLRQFRSVNVHMARTQEMSLNPVSINGCCGRLKCCLRYEHDCYLEAGAGLPANGSVVRWGDHEGVVVGREVLRRRVLVRTREEGLRHVAVDELTAVAGPAGTAEPKETSHEDPGGEWTEPGPARET